MIELQRRCDAALALWRARLALVGAYHSCVDEWGWVHPSTQGCMLALARDVNPGLHVARTRSGSFVLRDSFGYALRGHLAETSFASEAEALVAALEAAS